MTPSNQEEKRRKQKYEAQKKSAREKKKEEKKEELKEKAVEAAGSYFGLPPALSRFAYRHKVLTVVLAVGIPLFSLIIVVSLIGAAVGAI